jgi:hypothetical protein
MNGLNKTWRSMWRIIVPCDGTAKEKIGGGGIGMASGASLCFVLGKT